MDRPPASRWWTRCSSAASSRATTWRTRHAPTCAGASGAGPRPGRPMRGRSRFPGRSPSAASCESASPSSHDANVDPGPCHSTNETITGEEELHMKYLCLVYGEEKALAAMDDRDCVAYDEKIRSSGQCLASEALQPVASATTVRVRNGKVSVTDGPFAETKEILAGFYMIEARDLNEAIQVASKIPPAEVGSIEVRPIRPIRETVRALQKEGATHGVR